MIANVLYVLPMLLGRTYDLRTDRVGFDIFPQSELNKSWPLHEPESVSRYETADISDEVRNLLEVTGDLALKVKAGKIDLKGTGSYLRDSTKSERSIEILTRVKFKTYTVALPPDVQPITDFLVKYPPKELGTHFVRSVTYGGELIASIRFRTNKESDLKSVSAIVKGSFSGGEASSLVAEGKLEMVKSKLKDKASMEISYYATVPLKGVPNTIDGLRTLVRDFDKHVTEVNDGWGVPIRVELMEMESLGGANGSQFRFIKNKALEADISTLESEFDDLKKAQSRLGEWIKSLPAYLTKEQEEKIETLYKRIQKALRPYYDAIGKMNIEMDTSQFQKARDAYSENGRSLPGKFNREVDKLKRKVVITVKKLFGTGSSSYIRWGKTDCSQSPMNKLLYTGYVATSTNRGTGGSSEYLCLPEKPSFEAQPPAFGGDFSTVLAGARYGLMEENPFEGDAARNFFGHGIPCSVCHLTNRTLVTSFPAFKQCPKSGGDDDEGSVDWIYEYSGYLMSGSNLPGSYICVDEDPESHKQISDEQQTHSVTLSLIGEGTVPSTRYKPGSAVACVVCSK